MSGASITKTSSPKKGGGEAKSKETNAARGSVRSAGAGRLGNQEMQSALLTNNATGVVRPGALERLNQFLSAQPSGGQPIVHQSPRSQSILDSFGARGATAGHHVLISAGLGGSAQNAVLAHELTHVRQAAPLCGPIRGVGPRDDGFEQEAAAAGALGVPLSPRTGGADPSLVRFDYDQSQLFTTSIAPSWATGLTDQDLQAARTALAQRMIEFPEGSVEHDSARDNDVVLAEEISRRGTEDYQREQESRHMANRPQGPPVVFGIDNRERRIFASVSGTGATLEDVARFIYGSPSFAGRLAEDNSLVPGQMLAPGTTIRLVEGTIPKSASEILENSLKNGTIIRTDGIPATLQDDAMVYRIDVGGRQTIVNGQQFNAVLNGIRRATRIELNRIKGGFEGLLSVRNDHQRRTNSLVRGISDWMGDVDLPGQFEYRVEIGKLEALLAEMNALEFNGDPPANARSMLAMQRQLIIASRRLSEMEDEWHNYIEGTIHGAARTASHLETVRNVSFAAVAGMAGAVAAPVAFAALGTVGVTGGTATALSLGGAAITGGVVRGSLEAVAPGVQIQYDAAGNPVDAREDMRGAGERFKDTFYSGAVQGFTGGAGAFLAPVASSAVTGQLASRFGTPFVQSTAGQLTSQVATGMVLGAPTSVAGSALELAPQYARGDITGAQYAGAIGMSTLYGAGLGGATSVLPINGLYRSGRFGLRGAPVTPRWMLDGPASPLAPFSRHVPRDHSHPMSTDIPEGFHALPLDQLPAFVDDPGVAGYAWTRVRSGGVDQWAPIRTYGPRQDFELAWYNTPQGGPATNRVMRYGERTADGVPMRVVGSRATQRPRGDTYSGARRHPDMNFAETMPDGTVVRNVEGHLIDHADTLDPTPLIPNSAPARVNFTPEPPAWGSSRPAGFPFQGRNKLTERMRHNRPGGGTQYSQYEFYGAGVRRTHANAAGDVAPVPERIIFVEHGPDGSVVRAWDILTGSSDVQAGVGMRTAAEIDATYGMSIPLVPQAREIPVRSLPPGLLGIMAAPQMSTPEQ